MKIIVCVKQVPDTSGKVAVNPDGTLKRASMAAITNPDDLNAVEAALVLKEQTGAEVIVVSMGPPPAEGMLRKVMARGVDRAILVSAREFGGSDTYATSQILAAAMKKQNHEPYSMDAAMAKLFAAESASDVTRRAVQLFGGYGYTREYPVERMMRDAKITEIYEGTSEVQRMVISSHLGVK